MNLKVTALVVFAVLLVDFYLIGLIHFWGLTMNSFTGVNMIFALGLAVDYSTHIAHNFLLTVPPASCTTNREKRAYKARKAVSQMGSSVFHGGASTFLAISVLGFSTSYAFTVFFKTWIGIIIFGISNGFLLLPIILSEFGPLTQEQAKPSQASSAATTASSQNKSSTLGSAMGSVNKNTAEVKRETSSNI